MLAHLQSCCQRTKVCCCSTFLLPIRLPVIVCIILPMIVLWTYAVKCCCNFRCCCKNRAAVAPLPTYVFVLSKSENAIISNNLLTHMIPLLLYKFITHAYMWYPNAHRVHEFIIISYQALSISSNLTLAQTQTKHIWYNQTPCF